MQALNFTLMLVFFAAYGLNRLHIRMTGESQRFGLTRWGFYVSLQNLIVLPVVVLCLMGRVPIVVFSNFFFGLGILRLAETTIWRHLRYLRKAHQQL